ncbi:type I glyceraldehyde-3-phosphate dehydrogenase [Candidatus Acetothermia bacterium]|nr:type I glyceraldehyde-3-phosphate dehydrogenase [Candidatus Acetothermia bacterium]
MVRVAINGFGRMGRIFFRQAYKDPQIQIVALNSNVPDPHKAAYLLQHDSIYGRFPGHVTYDENNLFIDGQPFPYTNLPDPTTLPWKKHNVDVVLEATGAFRDLDKAKQHLTAGTKKILITAPSWSEMPTIVFGINEKIYDRAKHNVVSAASCTTNCLVPVAYVLHKEFGIRKGFMTTVHSYTASQNLVDGSNKDMIEGRAAAINVVPTSTGAAAAIGLVMPELKGKLDGMAFRVPTPTGSVVDLVAELEKEVTKEQLNETFRNYAKGPLKNIMAVSEWPLVSSDCVGDSHSSIVDLSSTMVLQKNLVKIIAFYDNEWGYVARLVDLIKYL